MTTKIAIPSVAADKTYRDAVDRLKKAEEANQSVMEKAAKTHARGTGFEASDMKQAREVDAELRAAQIDRRQARIDAEDAARAALNADPAYRAAMLEEIVQAVRDLGPSIRLAAIGRLAGFQIRSMPAHREVAVLALVAHVREAVGRGLIALDDVPAALAPWIERAE